jgi:hypothetical protein
MQSFKLSNRHLTSVAAIIACGIVFAAGAASAQVTPTLSPTTSATGPGMHGAWGGRMGTKPGVFGTVASVSGNTLTVTSKGRPTTPGGTPTETTFTVDGTNALVTKNNAASTIGAVAVGDTVMVQGTVTVTNVVATKIMDGLSMMGKRGNFGVGGVGAISQLQGNGQPVIGGSVSAVNGSMLSVVPAQGGITYSVDATNAKVVKDNATSSVSSIGVGDKVVVQGTINSTSVTASTVIDSGAVSTTSGIPGTMPGRRLGGFFGAIGGLFRHLFGFF